MSSALYLTLCSETLQSLQPTFMSPLSCTNIITNLRSVTLTHMKSSRRSASYITFISNQTYLYSISPPPPPYNNSTLPTGPRLSLSGLVLFRKLIIIEEVDHVLLCLDDCAGRDVWSRGREHLTKPLNNPHNNNNNNNNTSLAAWVGLLTPL